MKVAYVYVYVFVLVLDELLHSHLVAIKLWEVNENTPGKVSVKIKWSGGRVSAPSGCYLSTEYRSDYITTLDLLIGNLAEVVNLIYCFMRCRIQLFL